MGYYGFEREVVHGLSNNENFLIHQSGSDFFQRYSLHILEAFDMAFQRGRPREALDYLKDWEKKPGLHNFVPNLVMQSIILAAQRRYNEALAISERLKGVGRGAPVNWDYNILWRARIVYDPIQDIGDADRTLAMVDEYLARAPLKMDKYNDRILLFTIYRLRILLAKERFDEAAALVNSTRPFLEKGIYQQNEYFEYQREYLNFDGPKFLSPARLLAGIGLVWDMSTHCDAFATAVLKEEAYVHAMYAAKMLNHYKMASHYQRVLHWLREMKIDGSQRLSKNIQRGQGARSY